MMESTITTAAREYAARPADERYPNLDALITAAAEDKRLSVERAYNLGDLSVEADGDDLRLRSPRGVAGMSHWAFGQVSRMVGAPASYLRDELPASLAAECLTHGLKANAGQDAVLLARAPNGRPYPIIRAATSQSYGRVWDADLYGAFGSTLARTDDRWQLPPTWSGEPAGAYRGDRDSFVILVNGGSIVSDPSLTGRASGSEMYRGVMIRNSEVGASSVTIETVLYRYICGNHMLWGAMIGSSFRRRHVGVKALRDTMREVYRIARDWSARPESADQAIITGLIGHEIATTETAVVAELQKLGATKAQATAAYARAEQTESASPRSFWGVAQGLTRISQDSGFQDERYQLDRLAGAVMKRGLARVAA